MKKLVSLLAALLLAALGMTAALAAPTAIPDTTLSLDFGDLIQDEPTDEEYDDGMVLYCYDEAETIDCAVYVYDANGMTLADIQEEMAEDESTTGIGPTTINGIDTIYWLYTDDGDSFVSYFILDGENVVEISFWYADDAAAQQTGTIMATLAR